MFINNNKSFDYAIKILFIKIIECKYVNNILAVININCD